MATLNPVPPGREHWVISPEQHAAAYVSGLNSSSTRKNYGEYLRRWLGWCDECKLDPWGIDRRHIEAWIRTLPLSVARNAAAAICGFYADAHSQWLTERDLGTGVRRPRQGRSPRGTWATPAELARIVQLARDDGGDAGALLSILCLMGTRIGETLSLDVGDAPIEHGRQMLRLARKGSHVDVVACPTGVVEALAPLLERRSSGPLLRWKGRRMAYNTALGIVADVADRAGCEQHLTPHSLRRSFVTAARAAGASREEIMAMTGHSDPTMVDFYTRGLHQHEGAAARAVDEMLRGM